MKLNCQHRRFTVFKKGYCRLDSENCGFSRWAWCKGIIFGILSTITIAYFSYGVVYAWQRAEDRVSEIQEIKAAQEDIAYRLNFLEKQIEETDRTMVRYWKRYGRGR